jgi:hypothetical protein
MTFAATISAVGGNSRAAERGRPQRAHPKPGSHYGVDSRRGSADRPRRRRLIQGRQRRRHVGAFPPPPYPPPARGELIAATKAEAYFDRAPAVARQQHSFARRNLTYNNSPDTATSMRAPSTRGTCDARALAYLMMIVARRRPVLLRASQQFLKRFFVGPCNATS